MRKTSKHYSSALLCSPKTNGSDVCDVEEAEEEMKREREKRERKERINDAKL